MKLEGIVEILGAQVHTGLPFGDIDILAACGADLMSDALAFGGDKGLLLTGLNNPQSIRTAEMMDIHCVVIVRGKTPDASLITLAREKDIVLMSTKHSMFTACGLLYQAGISGVEV